MITLYESVLRFGRISLLPVNRAHTSVSRADTSARQRLHRRLRVDPERWMEMYQPRINTHNTQQLPLHQSNRCSRPNPDFCLSHGALCFHDLFIYTLIHILVLSGCGNGMCSLGSPCVPACVGGKVSLKEISSSSVMLTMGLRDLHCKPGAWPLTYREAMKRRENLPFPSAGVWRFFFFPWGEGFLMRPWVDSLRKLWSLKSETKGRKNDMMSGNF